MKRKDLEMRLQQVNGFERPKAELEQYMTPANIAADLLFLAYSCGDIDGRVVLDLGCGTGMLGIGAALLGASNVIGVDKDAGALAVARRNVEQAEISLELVEEDVSSFRVQADTVVMNPPFGAQNRHADRPFLETAMRCAPVIYSLHLTETLGFLARYGGQQGFSIDLQKSFKFDIPHTFAFHRKVKKSFDVSLIRFCKTG
jgi:putative methylase